MCLCFEKKLPQFRHENRSFLCEEACQIYLHFPRVRIGFAFIFQKSHGVFDDNFVFKSYKFNDLLHNPSAYYLHVNFAHINLDRQGYE